MNLEGKLVVVTGAFGTLGAAVVRAAQGAGARVAAIDRAATPGAAATLGEATLFGGVDLADSVAAKNTFDAVAQALGGIDGIVNAAGILDLSLAGSRSRSYSQASALLPR